MALRKNYDILEVAYAYNGRSISRENQFDREKSAIVDVLKSAFSSSLVNPARICPIISFVQAVVRPEEPDRASLLLTYWENHKKSA